MLRTVPALEPVKSCQDVPCMDQARLVGVIMVLRESRTSIYSEIQGSNGYQRQPFDPPSTARMPCMEKAHKSHLDAD